MAHFDIFVETNNILMIKKILSISLLSLFQLTFSQTKVLYGVTSEGGTNDNGVVFQYDLNTNTYTKKGDFNNLVTGKMPMGTMVLAKNHKLYGMTFQGGSGLKGVVFEFDPLNGGLSKKLDLATVGGKESTGSLVAAENGKLYGLTNAGGTSNLGIIFEYDVDAGVSLKKYDFASATGGFPAGGLLKLQNRSGGSSRNNAAAANKLYGLTSSGGAYSKGTVFEYDTATNIYTKLADFNGLITGTSPVDNLMQASNGKLYGMTEQGGASNAGVLFKFDIETNTLEKIVDFKGENGRNPIGALIEAANGKLYACTPGGGMYLGGVLYEYDPQTNIFTKRVDFGYSNTAGISPDGTLMEASNGKLYGMTNLGGLYNYGTIFEYDTETNVYTTKFDFQDQLFGSKPSISQFIEIGSEDLAISNFENKELSIYPNPVKNTIFINTKQEISKYEIYSIDGKKIISTDHNKTRSQINVSNLKQGNYIIKFTLKTEQTINQKFIKE